MINENESVPEIERLELREFNVNAEEQRKLDAMVEEEVMRVIQTQRNECKAAFIVFNDH